MHIASKPSIMTALISGLLAIGLPGSTLADCTYPSDRDSAGNRCGGRASTVIPGGEDGGDGRYRDSQGRQRIYGRGNDIHDDNYDSGLNRDKDSRFDADRDNTFGSGSSNNRFGR